MGTSFAIAVAAVLRLVGLPAGTSLELEPVPAAAPATKEETEEMVARAMVNRMWAHFLGRGLVNQRRIGGPRAVC